MLRDKAARAYGELDPRPAHSDDPGGSRSQRSQPKLASCCTQYASVEYWRSDALGQQSESSPLADDGAALRWRPKTQAHGGK